MSKPAEELNLRLPDVQFLGSCGSPFVADNASIFSD